MKLSTPWLLSWNWPTNVGHQLIFFPHAGGSAAAARTLLPHAGETGVAGLELPGRGSRFREQSIKQFDELVADIASVIAPLTTSPTTLCGHSLGGLLSFEVARRLQQSGHRLERVLVSGHVAPHCPMTDMSTASDKDLIDYLAGIGGTPKELLESAEAMELLLPIVRSDLELYADYAFRSGPKLTCPLIAVAGRSDPIVSLDDARRWSEFAGGDFAFHPFTGGHDFFYAEAGPIMDLLVRSPA